MVEPGIKVDVLLVDDEENILRSLQRLLMDEEFEVHTATSGEEGLDILRNNRTIGLIISDQRMPGMNGAEFLKQSRDIQPNAIRMLLTGYSDLKDTIDAINLGGAYRYISKPWEDEELINIIHEALERYQQEEEKRHLSQIMHSQNMELETWNDNMRKRLLQNAATIREKTETIKSLEDKEPFSLLSKGFNAVMSLIGDRNATHGRTVCTLVTDAARRMQLDSTTTAQFRLAALMHDAGKLGTMATHHSKHRNDMTDNELAEYRLHVERGEQLFSSIEELQKTAPLIRSHHEAYDGSGFPDRLKGDQIPLGARLITIADTIDNAARAVPYHRAEFAMTTIRNLGGSLLDPDLINLFQSITKQVYYKDHQPEAVFEVKIGPNDMVPGMHLSRDLKSGNGVLLLAGGTKLDQASISLIRTRCKADTLQEGIFIRIIEE